MSPTARHPRPTTAVPACEDCNDTGTITDPAPDAPRARLPEPCVSCPGRTLPVTPAERACATVLRAYLAWNTDEANDPEGTTAWWSMAKLGDYLEDRDLIDSEHIGPSPAGAALLARVEAEERTPEDIARELVVKLQTSGAPSYVVSDAQVLLTSCVRLAALDRLAATPPRKDPR